MNLPGPLKILILILADGQRRRRLGASQSSGSRGFFVGDYGQAVGNEQRFDRLIF
jgi:hypothetical protein